MAESKFSEDLPAGGTMEKLVYEVIFCDWLHYEPDKSVDLVVFDEAPSTQYSGVDIVVRPQGKSPVNIDVKAAVDWAGKGSSGHPMTSFTQEISYLKDGEVKAGWFVDDTKRTDYFAFCWIPEVSETAERNRGRRGYAHVASEEDVVEFDVAFIGKHRLREAIFRVLHQAGQDRGRFEDVDGMLDWFKKVSDECRSDPNYQFPGLGETGLEFRYSPTMAEAPVNLKVPQKLIKEAGVRQRNAKARRQGTEPDITWQVIPWV